MTQSTPIAERILAANARADALSRRRAAADARLDEARKTYEKLALEAREKYGTSDPIALQAEIERREKANLESIEKFEKELDFVDAAITEAERVLAG